MGKVDGDRESGGGKRNKWPRHTNKSPLVIALRWSWFISPFQITQPARPFSCFQRLAYPGPDPTRYNEGLERVSFSPLFVR